MSVFKKYKGKRLKAKDKDWSKGTWYIWKRINGRIIHKSLKDAQTKEQAEIAERKIIEAAFNRKYGIADSILFKDFADGPYTRYCKQKNVNIGAKLLYIRTLNKEFKGKALADITPQDCRDCQERLKRKATSSGSVNRTMSTLSKLFTIACEEGVLDRNPMQYVKSLTEPAPRSRLLTVEEKERLWMELEKDILLLRLVSLAINLPLRRGQLLAISATSLDIPNGVLLAKESKGRPPRVVPLNGTALKCLEMMMIDRQLPFPLKDFRKRWQRATVAAGINTKDGKRGENFTFHDLRKEFASELIRKNVNPNIVQKLFAHSDMAITNIYMHAEMDELKAAVNTLDEQVQQSEVLQ
jgi:integrase